MSRIQTGLKINIKNCYMPWKIFLGLCFLVLQVTTASAGNAIIKKLDFASLSGDELQIQLEVIGAFVEPKVFHTDNPARIALDFPATQSGLDKKVFPVNLGVVSNVYVVEAGGRVRVVVNLVESVPFETRMQGNKVIVSIKNAKSVAAVGQTNVFEQPNYLGNQDSRDNVSSISGLIPKQSIKHLDFRRGPKGEGRLLISLTSPDTVVNTAEKGGKVVLTFVNTELPSRLAKRMDVTDFATPVQMIDFRSIGSKTRVDVTMATSNYEYSSFQSEGLLTVEFRPLTAAEKAEKERDEFPYTGERLSLNFQSIPVRSVLQILADFTDLNIIASDSVGGSVTLRLDDVPWDQVLDLVLKSKGLSKRETGNVILVAPTSEINKIEKEQLAAEKIVEQLEPLRTEYIQVNYAKAENFRNLLQGATSIGSVNGCSVTSSGSGGSGGGGISPVGRSNNRGGSSGGGRSGRANDRFSLLSKRGTAIVDSRTNTLIVRDTAKKLEEMRKLFQLLDVPVRQVLIEARIVSASTDFAKEIGVRFGVAKRANIGSNKTFALGGRGTEGNGNVEVDDDGNIGTLNDTIVDLPAAIGAGSGGALGLTLIRAADYVLNLELSALQDEGRGELISNPRVMTSDRCEATIKQGTQIPFVSGSDLNRTITLVDAVLELKVTPQITPNGSIIMDLSIKKDSPGALLNGATPIDVQEVQTSVHVENGQTLVVGGIYERVELDTLNKVPFFADLPGVGFLFKKTLKNDNKTELLIFVTPKVVNDKSSIR
jgi:type IV pilus assembly protein PilQ